MSEGITLTWRASKRCWVGKYRRAQGDWPQKTVPREIAPGPRDRAKAKAWLIEHASNAEALKLEPRRRPSGRLMSEASAAWFAIREKDPRVSPSTLRGYRDLFKNVIFAPFKHGKTETTLRSYDVVSLAIDFSLVRQWIRSVSSALSPFRVRNAFSSLRMFFDDAIVEGWIRGSNPMRNDALVRELPPVPTERERGGVVFLPHEVAAPLLVSGKVPLARRVRYALTMTSGLREGEISGLTWEKLSLITPPWHVEIDQARRLERRKDEVLGPTKTRTSRRGLPIHPAAREALLEWAEDYESGVAFILGRAPKPSDPVFPSMRDGGFARPDIAELLRSDLEASGLPTTDAKGRPFTAHALRRTFGTWLERAGVDELTRKRLMGHGAHDVTTDYYTGENFTRMAEAVGRIELRWVTGVEQLSRTFGGGGGAGHGAGDTMTSSRSPNSSQDVRTSVASPARLELATCGLGNHDGQAARGATGGHSTANGRASADLASGRKVPSGRPDGAKPANGTKSGLARATLTLPSGLVISTDVEDGEPPESVAERLALAARDSFESAKLTTGEFNEP